MVVLTIIGKLKIFSLDNAMSIVLRLCFFGPEICASLYLIYRVVEFVL